MRDHCTSKARREPGFFWCARVPTDHLACIAQSSPCIRRWQSLHSALAVIFVCALVSAPRCSAWQLAADSIFSHVARRLPSHFWRWRIGVRLACCRGSFPTSKYRQPQASVLATLAISECLSLDALQGRALFLASHKRDRFYVQSVRLAKGSEIEERLCF